MLTCVVDGRAGHLREALAMLLMQMAATSPKEVSKEKVTVQMPIQANKVWKRRRLAMRASVQAMLFAVVAVGASSAVAQDDSAAVKRKNEYGLGATGQSSGQGLRRPDGVRDQQKEKRGNTPPGSDRAGDRPASGAIVDPAGVTK